MLDNLRIKNSIQVTDQIIICQESWRSIKNLITFPSFAIYQIAINLSSRWQLFVTIDTTNCFFCSFDHLTFFINKLKSGIFSSFYPLYRRVYFNNTGLQGFVVEKLWVVSGVIFDVESESEIRISLSRQDFEIFEVMCSKNGSFRYF